MGYSLRSRSTLKSEVETQKKIAVAKKPAVKKAAPAKKTAEIKKVEKKTEATKKEEKKTEIKKVANARNAAEPKKPAAKTAAKKVVAPKAVAKKAQVKNDNTADKAEVKKAKPPKKAAAKPSPAKKSASVSKPVAKKAAASPKKAPIHKIVGPVIKIEEISAASLPEVEPILHEEPEEKVIEIVEGQVVSTHIRFSDDETEDGEIVKPTEETEIKKSLDDIEIKSPIQEVEDGETFEESKEVSIKSSDFETLDDIKEEPTPFELYKSESETEEIEKVTKDEFDEEEEIKKEMPTINAHFAFEAFTSQEAPKTFNWNNSGSTYYKKPAELVEEEKSEPVAEAGPVEAPTVISNPFGFGFTSTNPTSTVSSKPNPYKFTSHFQSVSSPLDKLCNLTSKSNPLPVTNSNFSFGTSSVGTSSFLPTSPAAGFSKADKSPIEQVEDKVERSPSVIQSIIIDDKHEDFSAF